LIPSDIILVGSVELPVTRDGMANVDGCCVDGGMMLIVSGDRRGIVIWTSAGKSGGMGMTARIRAAARTLHFTLRTTALPHMAWA